MDEQMEIETYEISFKAKSKYKMYTFFLSGRDGIYFPLESDTHYKYIQKLC